MIIHDWKFKLVCLCQEFKQSMNDVLDPAPEDAIEDQAVQKGKPKIRLVGDKFVMQHRRSIADLPVLPKITDEQLIAVLNTFKGKDEADIDMDLLSTLGLAEDTVKIYWEFFSQYGFILHSKVPAPPARKAEILLLLE
jgi:hypothetical protein